MTAAISHLYVNINMKVQDYGVALKLNDGNLMLRAYFRLFKVFLCLDASHEYVRSMQSHLMCLLYWRKVDQEAGRPLPGSAGADWPFWKLFLHGAAAFNEECGEISFSVLARVLHSDSERTKIDHVNRKYRRVRQYLDAKDELLADEDDWGDVARTISGRHHIKEGDAQVLQTAEFLKLVANEVRWGVYGTYDDIRCFKNKADASRYKAKPSKNTPRTLRSYQAESVLLPVFELKDKDRAWAISVDAIDKLVTKDAHEAEGKVALLLPADVGPAPHAPAVVESDSESEQEMEVKLEPQDVVERDEAGDDDLVDLTETRESLASKAGLQLEDPSEEEDEKSEEGEQASDNDKSDAEEEDRHPRKRPKHSRVSCFSPTNHETEHKVQRAFEKLHDQYKLKKGKPATGAAWFALGDQARQEVNAQLPSRRRTPGRASVPGLYTDGFKPDDLQTAIRLSNQAGAGGASRPPSGNKK